MVVTREEISKRAPTKKKLSKSEFSRFASNSPVLLLLLWLVHLL